MQETMDSGKKTAYKFTLNLQVEADSLELAKQTLSELFASRGIQYQLMGIDSTDPEPQYPQTKFATLAKILGKYKDQGKLVRMYIVKSKGRKWSLPCRILNFDLETEIVSAYHVDEKRLYTFKLNEIEDVITCD